MNKRCGTCNGRGWWYGFFEECSLCPACSGRGEYSGSSWSLSLAEEASLRSVRDALKSLPR